jgi:hypothetical protein
MCKNPWLWLLLIAVTIACSQQKKVQRPTQSSIPVMRFQGDSGESRSLAISSLYVDIKVVGNYAVTTFNITYYNPFERQLEGEFDFPLADGQIISRYALDINGKMREGVVIEKAKARIAFENTVRQNIDPGIAEKTKGNSFRTRIFPIPAKGYKRVIIATEQPLAYIDKKLLYQLPVYSQTPIDSFSIKATVIKSTKAPELDDNELTGFKFSKWNNAHVAEFQQNKFTPNHLVTFFIPPANENQDVVFTERFNNKTYFYINRPTTQRYFEKKRPEVITLLWDISSSAQNRNAAKELELLANYLSHPDKVTVNLVPFNISAQSVIKYTVINGNAKALLDTLKSFYAEGGTQLGAINLNDYACDEVLLFSDGLSTFGKKEMVLGRTPVIAINSNRLADYANLKYIVQQTNGLYIDLITTETQAALRQLTNRGEQFLKPVFNEQEVEEVYTNGFAVAGILKTNSAVIKLQTGNGNEITGTQEVTISARNENDYENVKRIWASFKISDLELQYNKNKETITRLGKEFSIVTQNTSMIVLDRVEDYVLHEITPPVELQKEYFALLAEKQKNQLSKKTDDLSEALAAMKTLKKWYHTRFDQSRPAKKTILHDGAADSTILSYSLQGEAFMNLSMTDSLRASGLSMSFNYTAPTVERDGFDPDGSQLVMEAEKEPEIALKEWKPDVEYLKAIEQTPAQERLLKYRSLKKQYGDQPSFYVDMSQYFIKEKNKELGLLILSNINEMKLENAELLRMVANQLLEIGEKALAIETYKEIVSIREEHPQSYRDLALAENEAGNFQEALRLLYKLVTDTWDERFGDVKSIALNEMNAIISAQKGKTDISFIDSRLIYAMPVDVRIVIGWSSDNSDVDLWITDPYKQKCLYSEPLTRIGGKMSSDVTRGFGPEEFCLKKAVSGDYFVQVNLYGDTRTTLGGPISIKADCFTNFGKPNQERKAINVRVVENKDVVDIGKLTFAN